MRPLATPGLTSNCSTPKAHTKEMKVFREAKGKLVFSTSQHLKNHIDVT